MRRSPSGCWTQVPTGLLFPRSIPPDSPRGGAYGKVSTARHPWGRSEPGVSRPREWRPPGGATPAFRMAAAHERYLLVERPSGNGVMVHPARSRWHPVAARRSRGGRLAWTHPSPGAGSPPAASAHRSGSAGPPARKRCRCFANAAGVLETPGLSRNAALRKAAFSPEAGVVETLQAFRGLLQAFRQRCRRSAGERPTPGGGGVRDWTAPRPRRPTADASVWSSGGRTARTGVGGHEKMPSDGHVVARWRS